MRTVLFAWLGNADVRAAQGGAGAGDGPVAAALRARAVDEAVLLASLPREEVESYLPWVRGRTEAAVSVQETKLASPTDFAGIYSHAAAVVESAAGPESPVARIFHLSPGTPAMAAVWILLAKTRFSAELIESSSAYGVRTVSFPFDLAAEFIPDALRAPDDALLRLTAGLPPDAPEFDAIVHRSPAMKRAVALARRAAPRSAPVLIQGETGTGKELFARAIHRASPRRGAPFVAVNCGAIAAGLIDSELFGHVRGAFTDAARDRAGAFREASRGTLFLDEVGELPLDAQVRLLRALQEGKVRPVGSDQEAAVDVRVVSATNRNLNEEAARGRFREDLFHRIAVAIVQVPPLRKREGDVGLLIDFLLARVNEEAGGQPGFERKRLSAGARNLLLRHSWPGNVRELLNTLQRAAIWSSGDVIEEEDALEAILPVAAGRNAEILGRPLGRGFELQALLAEVTRHYLARALEEAHGDKTAAAALVGLPSRQTFTNWLKKYGPVGDDA